MENNTVARLADGIVRIADEITEWFENPEVMEEFKKWEEEVWNVSRNGSGS